MHNPKLIVEIIANMPRKEANGNNVEKMKSNNVKRVDIIKIYYLERWGHIMKDFNIKAVSGRIRALREDSGLTMQEMAKATGRSVAEYAAQESGEQDMSFTFLHKCARELGVDVVDLITGESPNLKGYSLVRAGNGLPIGGNEKFEYLHMAPNLKHRLAEPFVVTIPYLEKEQDQPIHLSYHEGQELDFVISGRMRFAYEDKTEEAGPGDLLMYDSGRGHGMIAIGGEPCIFLAIVIKPEGKTRII